MRKLGIAVKIEKNQAIGRAKQKIKISGKILKICIREIKEKMNVSRLT